MSTFAVVKTGGKQYVVKENDELVVDRLDQKEKDTVELPVLTTFDSESGTVELGMPETGKKVKATVLAQLKGDKIRVAKFKAKVRYRKVRGFRAQLTSLKILKIA
jgi:large subunit ribosomal protein L21